MTKNQIVKKLIERKTGADINGIAYEDIIDYTDTLDILVDIITDALLDGDNILWKGFLSIKIIEHYERKGRNPQTGEVDIYTPKKSINCRISQNIKDMVNNE